MTLIARVPPSDHSLDHRKRELIHRETMCDGYNRSLCPQSHIETAASEKLRVTVVGRQALRTHLATFAPLIACAPACVLLGLSTDEPQSATLRLLQTIYTQYC
jgi:hypothetical protein